MTIEILKIKFLDNVLAHRTALSEGNSKAANKLDKRLSNLYQKAKEAGLQDFYIDFLDYPNDSVKVFAASFVLSFNPELALEKLTELTKIDSIEGVTAKVIIGMWEKGMFAHLD